MRQAIAAAVLIGLSGCFWSLPGASPTRQAHNALESRLSVATVPDLEQLWQATVDAGQVGDPVTSISGVHVSDFNSVYSFDPATGGRRWRYSDPAFLLMYQPYVWRDSVLASQGNPSGNGSRLVQLDLSTGEVLREVALGALTALRQDVGVTIDQRVVCAPTCGHLLTMTVQDLQTGEQYLSGLFAGSGSPTSHEMTLGQNWVLHRGPGVQLDNQSEPRDGLRAYSLTDPSVSGCPGVLDLCPSWSVNAYPSTIALSDDETTLYTGPAAYDVATGTQLWRNDNGHAWSAAVADGRLYAVTTPLGPEHLSVYAENGCGSPTCAPLWTAPLGGVPNLGEPRLQPAVAGGVVFVAGNEGVLYAFDAAGCGAATCEPLWSASVGSEITGAPAVSNGQLYVGTADGRLVAFGLPRT